MANRKNFNVIPEEGTYSFYNEIAAHLNRPVEAILSDTLYKYVEIIIRLASQDPGKV